MVTRLILADAAGRVLITADWRHPERLEPFILANLPEGGTAYAVTVRTRAHFVDYDVPPAARSDAHAAMLRQAREMDVREFIGATHRLVLDATRRADGELEVHAAYAVRTQDNGVPGFDTLVSMPDEVIDGRPRPLYRRRGNAFERWQRGAWRPHVSDHTRHVLEFAP